MATIQEVQQSVHSLQEANKELQQSVQSHQESNNSLQENLKSLLRQPRDKDDKLSCSKSSESSNNGIIKKSVLHDPSELNAEET